MVHKLFAEALDSVLVQEPELEIIKTEKTSILKLVTEDVLLIITAFFSAEDMVDQTKVTNPLKLMLNAQEHHGDHIT
jgi:hypothetical protein